MTKKRIFIALGSLLFTYLCYLAYILVLSPKTNLQPIYLIPKDAVFIIESDTPVESWAKVSESAAWQHLQGNDYFAKLTESIQKVDTIFKNQRRLFDLFDNRSLFTSVHMYRPKEYAIFYVLDLKRIANLKLLKTYLNTLLNENYILSKRNYHQHEILEVLDKESKKTLHLAFIKNQMVASYTHTLVEASIDQYQEPDIGRDLDFIAINQKVGYDDLVRLYVQYEYLDDYYRYFSNQPTEWVNRVSENFLFSGFSFDLNNTSKITADGFTNISLKQENYLEALQKSGKAERTVPKIAPEQTALYISYGFDSFAAFYENFEAVQKANDSEAYNNYLEGIQKVERLLKIDVKKNFVDWIGEEIALLQIKSQIVKGKNDLALVLKTKDVEAAKQNLEIVLRQIKKKTPVKFKAVHYKGHEINFLSIKGFFKILLGNRFSEFDKPYFTIIDEYVVFSNSPNTLKSMISNVVDEKTLDASETFAAFNKEFESESSLFVYANIPILYDNMLALADRETQRQMKKNKDFIICFPEMGFQMTPEETLFESRLVLNYQEVDAVRKRYAELNKPQVSHANRQSGQTSKPTRITDAVFNLRPIYPTDLNAKSFIRKYASGAKRFEVALKDGKKHGRYIEYHTNGEKKITGRFREDEQVGTWRFYDDTGNLLLKKRF